ncbi:4-coumarate--CoA ligase [Rhodoblastus acidophilus]|uniref:4-coumarate--CoA ligase n=1 Tax=Rhodoblastus acidophilus TaxID=1074 RepID=UPI0022248B2B|nr:4-coumarate--CoA ligase [Rhodoblastus acidophilus]MCW2319060.1 4-coumarate--CoA ligase [Rhodoblastus acidophilus]
MEATARIAPPASAKPPALEDDDIRRLLRAILADEWARLRKKSPAPDLEAGWDDATRLDEDGVGFDSLALLEACSRVSQFFHLHEVGIEDYLFVRRELGQWVNIVRTALDLRHERLTFQTSGSSGTPKPCTHEVGDLLCEIEAHALIFAGARRVLALVPCHHIYGFLFTVLLPRRLDAPVLDARAWSPGILRERLRDGDLLVATPVQWRALRVMLTRFPEGLIGVSSTAPMPEDLRGELAQAGLARLVEIYGASETAGVGFREDGGAFTLLPFWRRCGDGLLRDGADAATVPQDDLVFSDDVHFTPRDRRDGAIKVGGVNVFPERVATALRAAPSVADCAVRGDGDGVTQRLKCFVVLTPEAQGDPEAPTRIVSWIAENLSPRERPVVTFGSTLPRNAMGKTADW